MQSENANRILILILPEEMQVVFGIKKSYGMVAPVTVWWSLRRVRITLRCDTNHGISWISMCTIVPNLTDTVMGSGPQSVGCEGETTYANPKQA